MDKTKMPFVENVIVTPQMARKFLDSMVGNRVPSKSRCAVYAADMRNGRWELNGETIKVLNYAPDVEGDIFLIPNKFGASAR